MSSTRLRPRAQLSRNSARNGSRSATRRAVPIRGPFLVLAGDDDRSVAIANITASVRDACKRGRNLEFVHRPGLDHDPLMDKTAPEQLAWAHDRLAGKPWHGNCTAMVLPFTS